MPTPTNRTPLRVARGTYSNLNGSLTDLQEGEITFATDEGKLYVKQGSALTSVSSSSQAAPTPSDVTASPAFVSGAGTSADPFVITSAASPFAGGTLNSAQQITIANGNPGDLVVFTDNSAVVSDRFKGQEVGTINSAGNYTFKLNYTDTPNTTTNATTYAGSLQVGSVHFQWTVVQSALAPLSQATATAIATSGLAVGNTITATAGTAAGGTSPYTYAVRWERSFNGTSGWFDTGYTGLTYTIVQADAGYYVRAVATASDSTAGSSGGPLTLDLPSVATSQININSLADITNVVLAEDDTTGARFTSKNFSADASMNPEGVPTSTKAVKVKFSGTFVDYPATDNVTAVTDNDPADIAYSSSSTSITSMGGNVSYPYMFAGSVSRQSVYYYNDDEFMRFNDNGSYKLILFKRGASGTYWSAAYPQCHIWSGWDGPNFPADSTSSDSSNRGVTTSSGHSAYKIRGDTTEYSVFRPYGTTNSYHQQTQYADTKSMVEDSNGHHLGLLLTMSESTFAGKLFFTNGLDNSNMWVVDNTPSTSTNSIMDQTIALHNVIGVPSVKLQKGQSGYFRFYTINSGFNSDWSNSYTDVAYDDIISSTDAFLSAGNNSKLMASSQGDANGQYHTFLYNWYDTSASRYKHLLLWIDKSDDPTVASNWNDRVITIAATTTNIAINDDNNTYVDSSGKVFLSIDNYTFVSTDFGANWTTSYRSSEIATRPNITNIYNIYKQPYYVDGHWFIVTTANNSGNGGAFIRASNNNGTSWFDVAHIRDQSLGSQKEVKRPTTSSNTATNKNHNNNVFMNRNGRLLMMANASGDYSRHGVWYLNYDTVLTLASTQNLTGLDIQVGDTLRQGSVTGVVISISGSTVTLGNVSGVFSTGSPVQNTINHSGGSAGTLYAIVGGSGAISDLQSTDPGFTNLGSNPNITLSLPATFPTGNTPDVELPSGTTLQVTVQATNSSGSDTLDSNIITPS